MGENSIDKSCIMIWVNGIQLLMGYLMKKI